MAIVTEKTITLADGSTHHADPAVRLEVQKAEMAKLSGVKVDPNAGRIGGLPLTARPATTRQPGEAPSAPVQPSPLVGGLPLRAAAAVVAPAAPTAPAGGRVGDPRHQQAMAATIAAKIDPESERIINERYAALTPEQREKSQAAHFNDLVRLREGQRIVNGKWATPAESVRDPATGQFTTAPAVEDVSGLAPWAQAPRLTAVQKALVTTGSAAEMAALYDSGTPEQKAHWDGLAAKQVTAERAAGWVPANELTVGDLHGYTLPGFVMTNTFKRDELSANLKAARAAGISQAQVSEVLRNLHASTKK